MCTANDYKLVDVAQYIDKLKKRYPDGFSSKKQRGFKSSLFINQNEIYITIFYDYIFTFYKNNSIILSKKG